MSEAPRPRSMRLWLRTVLFVSLALNLAVIGLAAGFLLRGPPERGIRDRDPAAPYTRAFSEDQRRELWHELRRGFRDARDSEEEDGRRDVLSEYRAALNLLRATPFDAEAFRAIIAEQSDRSAQRRKRGEAVLTGYVMSMTDAERAQYADRLESELAAIEERRSHWKRRGD